MQPFSLLGEAAASVEWLAARFLQWSRVDTRAALARGKGPGAWRLACCGASTPPGGPGPGHNCAPAGPRRLLVVLEEEWAAQAEVSHREVALTPFEQTR